MNMDDIKKLLDEVWPVDILCVDELPAAEEVVTGRLYVLLDGNGGYETYYHVDDGWVSIDSDKEHQDEYTYTKAEIDAMFETADIKNPPSNCKNCGAPLTDGKCDYCGTEY